MAIARYLVLALLTAAATPIQSPDIVLTRLLGNLKLQEAGKFIAANHDRFIQAGASDGAAPQYRQLLETAALKDVAVDEHGIVSAVREGQHNDSLVAVVTSIDAPQAINSIAIILFAIQAAQISPKTGLLFIGVKTGDNNEEIVNLRDFLENGPYHGRIRSCLFVQASAEGTVFGPDNAIGSTIVQYGLQSVGAYAGEPNYAAASGILEAPIQLRIPAVGLGVGDSDGKPTVRAIQIVMTAILAVAGI